MRGRWADRLVAVGRRVDPWRHALVISSLTIWVAALGWHPLWAVATCVAAAACLVLLLGIIGATIRYRRARNARA